jgi:acetyl esterase/lipase
MPVALVCAQEKAQPGRQNSLPPGTKLLRDLEYVPNGHERQKLDLYLPEKAPQRPLPVIVWIHGGGWRGGSKERPPGLGFVSQGYALASIHYRLSQHARFPAQIEDCKAAIRWLRAHAQTYQLDPHHIGVWGASAGGHLVALLGTSASVKDLEGTGGNADQSGRVQAVVDLFGPTDFLQMGGTHNNRDSPESQLIGGPIQENKDKAARANPLTYITADAAPILIFHGDKDPLVPLSQSEILVAALQKAGVQATLKTLPGAGHGGPAFSSPENLTLIAEFFDKHLKEVAKKGN